MREGPLPTRLFDNAPDNEPTVAEREGLAEIRRRRTTMWLILLLMPAAAIASAFFPKPVPAILIGLGMLGFLVAILRHNLTACPRCGDRFNYLNPWTQACVFCGLRLREPAAEPKANGAGKPS